MKLQAYLERLKQLDSAAAGYADTFNKLGLVLFQMKEFPDALDALEEALEINPQYIEAGVNRAFTLGEIGKSAEGFRVLRQMHARSPDDFNTVLPLGIFCLRHGWKEEGLALLLRAERMRPSVPYVIAYAAAAHLELGDDGAACERTAKARGFVDNLASRHRGDDGKPFPDLDAYRRWENPFVRKLHMLLAQFSLESEDLEGAEGELMAVLSVFPGYVPAMVEMGKLALARSRNDEAFEWFTQSLAIDESCHEARCELAFLHAAGGDLEKAVCDLRAAVALRPLFPDYRYNLGMLLMAVGKKDEATGELKKALLLEPSYGHVSLHLAIAHLEGGNTEEAIAVLESSTCQDWPEALVVAAEALLKSGRRQEAVEAARSAVAVDRSNTDALKLLESMGA